MSSVCFNAVDKVMDNAVADLIAQLVVIHEDVAHRLCFQQLLNAPFSEKGNKTKDFFFCMRENR